MLEPLRQLYSIPSMGYARKTVAVILDSLRGVCSKNRASYTQFTEWGMLEPLLQLYLIPGVGYARTTAAVTLDS